MKTDILKELLYFSYDKNSLANIYPLTPDDVREIMEMNRHGEKPESLKGDISPASPEFVTSVGDDAINRFDRPSGKNRKNRKKSRNNKQFRENNGA